MVEQISWWHSAFGDVGWKEREAINRAAVELDNLRHAAAASSGQLARLFELDRAQGEEIERLRLMVRVLTELMVESKAVDGDQLNAKMQAALQAQEEAKRPKEIEAPPADYSGQPKTRNFMSKTIKKDPVVRCGQCSEELVKSDSNLTEWGLICDGCYYRSQATE